MTTSSLWGFMLARELAAILMAAAGALIAWGFQKIGHRGLCILISFAAGALLAVAAFDIIPEAAGLTGWLPAIISIFSGYLLFFLITRFVFHICPACAATHTEVEFKAMTWAMITALAVHSFMDGLAIYSGYLTEGPTGILTLLAVAFHKLPEGMALTLVARASGKSRGQAFLISVLLEAATTLAGGVVGLLTLVPESSLWIGYVMGHVAGGFIFLVVHALFSEFIKHHPRSTLLSALAGAGSIGLIGYCVGAF